MPARTSLTRLCFIGVLFFTLPASAAEWKRYYYSDAGVTFSIDTTSIVHLTNGYVRAWQKQEASDGEGSIYLLEVDCRQQRRSILSVMPIKKAPEDLEKIPAITTWYKGWDFFEPNDQDKATYTEWCQDSKNQ